MKPLVISSIFINAALLILIFVIYTYQIKEATKIKEEPPDITYNAPFTKKHIAILTKLIDNGSVTIVNKRNNILLGYYNRHSFTPASIIKLATSASAIHYLGSNYRFKTQFSLNNNNLYIRGLGDPLLTSNEIRLLVKGLIDSGLKKVNSIYLDASFFDSIRISGIEDTSNAYDAVNTALTANYNTISYKLKKTRIRLKGRRRRYTIKYDFIQGEKETPMFPFALSLLNKARDEILGNKLLNHTKISIGNKVDSLLYFGNLLKYLLAEHNIRVSGNIEIREVPKNIGLFYTHYSSKSLSDVVEVLLKYSNNFVANQLTMAIGYKKFNKLPVSLGYGLAAINDFLTKEVGITKIKLIEGSGVSYANRVTGDNMVKLLAHISPYKSLLPKYTHNTYAKTGALKTVSSLAGYIDSSFGELRFAIILNQSTNNRNDILKVILDTLNIDYNLN